MTETDDEIKEDVSEPSEADPNPFHWSDFGTVSDLLDKATKENVQVNLAEVGRTLNGLWNISLHASKDRKRQIKNFNRLLADQFLDEFLDEMVGSKFRTENTLQKKHSELSLTALKEHKNATKRNSNEVRANATKRSNTNAAIEQRREMLKQRDWR